MNKPLNAGLLVLAMLFAGSAAATQTAAQGALSYQAIAARLQPVGTVCVQGHPCGATAIKVADAGQPKARSGKTIYENHCSVCHASGMAGAPKFGNAMDWKPHIAKGLPTLYKHAMNGYNAMPPKGMCSDCSEKEIENAVNYMVNHSK